MEEQIRGRVLPHNEDAERAVLGAILCDALSLETAMEYLVPSDFYHTGHRTLYAAIIAYSETQPLKSLDMLSIVDFLRSRKELEKCGGASYISGLTQNFATSASIGVHAQMIHSLALRRRFIQLGNEFASSGFDEAQEIVKLIDESEQKLSDLAQGSGDSATDSSIGTFIAQALKNLSARMSGSPSSSLETGFDRLDSMTDGGFQPTDFIIIAARPAIGKTAFASSIIMNMIMPPRKYNIAFFSLEMSGLQVAQRLISSVSKVPMKIIKNAGFASQKDRNFNHVMAAAQRLFESNLFIIDKPNMKLSEIRATARRLKREKKVQAIFIDYIGLIDAEMPATTKKFEQVTEISKALKSLARELEIPVVVLCQVTRDAEGEKEPQLNNLRDSGAIEQDADMVIFLHRARKIEPDKFIKDEKGEPCLQKTKVIVAKQRNGETGEFVVGFKPSTASFENIADNVWNE